jgi:protein-tyrosine-phosphatase
MSERFRMAFICVENSNRSQMAQAFATMLGNGQVEAFSAGSRPSGVINPRAIAAMAELGYDLSQHHSKSIVDLPSEIFDFVATMGCGDNCPHLKANYREDWQIPDPRQMDADEFRKVRDLIRSCVEVAIRKLIVNSERDLETNRVNEIESNRHSHVTTP